MAIAIEEVINQCRDECSFPSAFIYGKKDFQNIKADNKIDLQTEVLPGIRNCLVLLDEPITSEDVYTQGGAVRARYSLKIGFGMQGNLGNTYDQNALIIRAMRAAAREYFLRLLSMVDDSNTKIFESMSSVQMLHFFNYHDVCLTGVFASFQITPYDLESVCITPAPSNTTIEILSIT